jgi:hypothetical protein
MKKTGRDQGVFSKLLFNSRSQSTINRIFQNKFGEKREKAILLRLSLRDLVTKTPKADVIPLWINGGVWS